MDRNSRIVISGAGVAGLTAAIWLGRAGFRPIVVEKSPRLRADGYIISLSHASYRYADQLGLIASMRALNTQIRESSYHDRRGRAMLTLDYERLFDGVDIVQIMRDDLQTVLYDAAQDVAEFRFGTSISALEQVDDKARLRLSDATELEADVVIGADGLHSATRAMAFSDADVRRIFFGIFSSAYRLPNSIGLEQRFENHMERQRYMCVYTTRGDDLACVFIWQDDGRSAPAPAQREQVLRERYSDAPELVLKVLEAFPQEQPVYMDPLIQIEMPRWSNGSAVLLGDAAHCLTLLSGQGASSAFWGASALATALVEHDKATAFARYERELRPVINQIQPATRAAAKWYIPATRGKYWARDGAMKLLPNQFFQRYFKRKYTRA